MSTQRTDVAVIGAGLNGLVAASYLCRAGRSVVVLESRGQVGGTVSSEELAPGFRTSSTHPSAENLHPSIVADLRLADHGLELLKSRGGTYVPAAGGASLVLGGDPAAALGQGSQDAAAWRRFDAFLGRLAAALEPLFTQPLPEVVPTGVGDVMELLTLGFRLRRLGREEMPEAMRFLPMPLRDVLDDTFSDETLKAAIAGPALRSTWLSPRSAGSALQLLAARPAWGDGLLSPPVFVKGGLGALASAAAAAAEAAGAEVRTGCRVERIVLDDDGRAVGVALRGGEEIAAQLVVSNADPKRTLLELSDPAWLDPHDAFMVRNIRSRGTVAVVQLALGELPRFTGAPAGDTHLAGRIQIGATLDELELAFDPVKYGELPERPALEITIPSLTDPSLAPQGRHVMHVWAQYIPHELRRGSWDERRDELGDRVVERIAELAPGFAESIEHRQVLSPQDIENRYGLTGGALYHVEPALDQALFMRPMPGWYQHRTPIDGLYLCGPGTPAGGGVTGLPGKNAAAQILADWKGGAIG